MTRLLAVVLIRLCAVAFVAGCLLGAGSGCGPRRVPLQVTTLPADADVFVDDRFVGSVSQLGGKLRVLPGRHRIEIRRDGYYRHYADLEVPATSDGARLEVKLAPRVDLGPGTGLDEIE
jgi:hypothetical protein